MLKVKTSLWVKGIPKILVAFCFLRLYLPVFMSFVPMDGKNARGIKHGHGKTKIKIDHFRNNFLHIIILLPYYRVLAGF